MTEVLAVTPEMNEAWCAYEPVGQFAEHMSFARFNGMMRHAFMCGYAAASVDTRRMAETGTGSGRSPSGAVAEGETPND